MTATRVRAIAAITGFSVMFAACAGSNAGTASPSAPGPSVAAPSSAASASTTALPTEAPFVADIDVGGRTLHIVCLGPTDTGRPTAIFESGLGGDLTTWRDVLPGLQTTDRGCSYDRAGLGMSQPATTPRTTKDQVADLHALLAKAGIKPPYVLVGHSLGGWNALVYAAEFPGEVAGAVLVDVRPPSASARWLAALPPASPTESGALKESRDEFTTFEHDPSLNPEGLDLATSAQQAEASAGFGSRPLVVLTAAGSTDLWEGLDPELATKLAGIWSELQAKLTTLSTNGRQIMVPDSGHDIPGERPDAVIEAIRAVLTGGT